MAGDAQAGTGAASPAAPVAAPVATGPRVFSSHAIHLVRTATQANLTLSQMADQKASLLMGATFVVFTISVSQASRGQFPLSLLVLAAFAFVSAMLAVAAVVPKVGGAPARRDPSGDPAGDARQNLLFFGVFARMDEDAFADAILAELGSDEQVFRTMLRDIHQNGQVLQHKKYRYLGYAFRIFQFGLSLTFLMVLYESRGLLAGVLAG